MIYYLKKTLLLLLIANSANIYSCKKDSSTSNKTVDIEIPKAANINNLYIPASYNLSNDATIYIKGTGFQNTDTIVFKNNDRNQSINTTIKELSNEGILINNNSEITEGQYNIILKRNNHFHNLGKTNINSVFNPNIPDIAGKNIKGVVHCDGKGIPNVIVSDGKNIATTDQNGIYHLESDKQTGYVFISIPGNYEVAKFNNNLPVFYQFTNPDINIIETKDFELKTVNNENHILISIGDIHLANRNDDIQQFQDGFVKDVNQQIENYKSQGKKIYGLTLGDLTWDAYWYNNNFMLPEYVKQIKSVNMPIFNTIGNHDNDPYISNDWSSENIFRRTLGPTYYSFNLGNIHYIVLDNTEYLNKGASVGTIGDREYNAKISDQQLNWLQKDLSTITSNTPIIIATHIQIHNAPNANGSLPSFRMSNAQQFLDLLSNFNNVHILTGHTHVKYKVERTTKIMEHNLGAVCGTWWWTGRTGYANNNTSPDGSPAGYAIWEMNNKDIKWYYKSIGFEPNYQFRTYDLNNVHITASSFAPNANVEYQGLVPQYASNFANANKNNEVLINLWGYDPKWDIEVKENGTSLTVTRISSFDPLHIISYAMKRLNVNAIPTFDSNNTSHMFKVKANSANSTLEIKVTDRFGNQYKETMVRPKAFSTAIK